MRPAAPRTSPRPPRGRNARRPRADRRERLGRVLAGRASQLRGVLYSSKPLSRPAGDRRRGRTGACAAGGSSNERYDCPRRSYARPRVFLVLVQMVLDAGASLMIDTPAFCRSSAPLVLAAQRCQRRQACQAARKGPPRRRRFRAVNSQRDGRVGALRCSNLALLGGPAAKFEHWGPETGRFCCRLRGLRVIDRKACTNSVRATLRRSTSCVPCFVSSHAAEPPTAPPDPHPGAAERPQSHAAEPPEAPRRRRRNAERAPRATPRSRGTPPMPPAEPREPPERREAPEPHPRTHTPSNAPEQRP
jgi:hypothetical protein